MPVAIENPILINGVCGDKAHGMRRCHRVQVSVWILLGMTPMVFAPYPSKEEIWIWLFGKRGCLSGSRTWLTLDEHQVGAMPDVTMAAEILLLLLH